MTKAPNEINNKVNNRIPPIFITALFLASVFVLSVFRTTETDLWMHLNLGKLIWELKGLPSKEIFVFSSGETPFFYTSWLFAVPYYLIYSAFGVPAVTLLKAAVIVLAFYIMLRDSLGGSRAVFVPVFVLSLAAIVSRYRFVERPETFAMVFIAFTVFAVNAYINGGRRYIYAVPFVDLLWANMHSSVILTFVIFAAYISGGMLQSALSRRGLSFPDTPSNHQLKTMSVVFAAAAAATLINPNFTDQYLYGWRIMSNPWWKIRVIEFRTPTWETDKALYFYSALLASSFIVNRKKISLISVLVALPFALLGLYGRRFLVPLCMATGAAAAKNFASAVAGGYFNIPRMKRLSVIAMTFWLVGYPGLFYAQGSPLFDRARIFGLGANEDYIPEKALTYMDERGIYGKVMNSFQWGGYIALRDFPRRTVFVDPRGNIPDELLDVSDMAGYVHFVVDDLEKKFGFESVLWSYSMLPRQSAGGAPGFIPGNILSDHQGWALVYWDDVSLLYLKRGGRFDETIKRDEYRYIRPEYGPDGVRARMKDEDYRANVVAELQRNIAQTGSEKAYALLGAAYNELRQYDLAEKAFLSALKKPGEYALSAYNGLAEACQKTGRTDESISYFKKSLALKSDPVVLYKQGMNYLAKGEKKTALKFIEESAALNPDLYFAYPVLIGLYREEGAAGKAESAAGSYQKALVLKEAGEYSARASIELSRRRYNEAAAMFEKAFELAPSKPVYLSRVGDAYYEQGQLEKAYASQLRALQLDPSMPSACLGLARIYEKKGELREAKKYYGKFISLDPEGVDSHFVIKKIRVLDEKLKGRS